MAGTFRIVVARTGEVLSEGTFNTMDVFCTSVSTCDISADGRGYSVPCDLITGAEPVPESELSSHHTYLYDIRHDWDAYRQLAAAAGKDLPKRPGS